MLRSDLSMRSCEKCQIDLSQGKKLTRIEDVEGVKSTVYEYHNATVLSKNMEADNKTETKSSESPASKDKNKHRVSVRFQLELTDSTDRSFPEFSYLELIGTAKKNKKKEDDVLSLDEECNMEEIRALAKKFEEKYAPKGSVVKKNKAGRTDRFQDLVDVTYGYDTTDTFVDDSEAHDELVPADWTTEHGGFYINMGELNFRPLSSGDEKSDSDFKDSRKKKTPKKKKEHKEKKTKEGKRCHSSGEKEKSVKKIRLNSDDKEKKVKDKKTTSSDGQSNGSKGLPLGSGLSQNKNTLAHNSLGTLNLQSPVIKLEKSPIPNGVNAAMSTNSTGGVPMDTSYSANENDGNLNSNGSASVTLPEGLPPSLILSIQKLIEAARKAGGDGKCKFFNMDVNRILLQIETDSRKLNCRSRSAVYDYLALFLPCTKDTLLKRAKNVFMQEQVGRLREPLIRLRHAVEVAMPNQVKHYEGEMAKLSEDQTTQSSQKPCSDAATKNGEKKDEPGVKVHEVDGENDKSEEATTPTDVNAPTTPVEEKGKRTIVPKRFVWKEDIRNLLCEVVKIKVELYLMSKSRSTTAEEALKGFLETEVRPIWPKGWMTTRILYRESKHAHAKVTSTVIAKAKKVLKKPKDEESSEMDTFQQQEKMVLNVQKDGEKTKLGNDQSITAVSLSTNSVSSAAVKTGIIQPNNYMANHSINKDQGQPLTQPATQPSTQPQVSVQSKVPVKPQVPDQPQVSVQSKVPVKPQVPDQAQVSAQSKVSAQLQAPAQLRVPVQLQPQIKLQVQGRSQAQVPAQSQGPVYSQVPFNPQVSAQSKVPVKPPVPAQPKVSVKPQVPAQPKVSVKPQVPVQPQAPVNPQVPVNFQVPVKSQVPVNLQVSVQPKIPFQPKVPVKSQVPVQAKVQIQSQVLVQPQIPVKSQVLVPAQTLVQPQSLIQPNVRPQQQVPTINCGQLTNKTTTKPKVTGRTILDLLETNTGRISQLINNTIENKALVNQIKKPAAVTTTNALPSCSFQNLSHPQLAQISPPRSIKSPSALPVSPPSHSCPNRLTGVNISPVRQISSDAGKFNPVSPVSTKRLPSCSLMSSPTLPPKNNHDSPPSPVSSRQNYNYINNLPSSPSLGYKFGLQSQNMNGENLQRTSHSNAMSTNYMGLTSPVKSKPQMTATSLLNSIARSSISQSPVVPSNSSLLGQSSVLSPSIQNPLQNIATSLSTNPHNISSIMAMQNNVIQNKPLTVQGIFPTPLSNFSGLQRQFANQPVMHRNTTTKEQNEGNNTLSSYQSTYRPPFS